MHLLQLTGGALSCCIKGKTLPASVIPHLLPLHIQKHISGYFW